MRPPAALIVAIAAAALIVVLGGCGSGDSSTTSGGATGPGPASGSPAKKSHRPAFAGGRCSSPTSDVTAVHATAIGCPEASRAALAWTRRSDCAPAVGASRAACSVAGLRCQSVRAGDGVSVSCSSRERAVAFRARPEG